MEQKPLRIVSLNVGRKNPFGKLALRMTHRRLPDIVCLQEVLQSRIDHLTKLGYKTGQVADYQHIGGQTGFVTTGVRSAQSIISVEKARYYDSPIAVPWAFIYQKVAKLRERHEGLVTTFRRNGEKYRVVNLHLSTACGPRVRISQLTKMLQRFADGRTIFCGDFNIVSDMMFKIIAGWACGYTLGDYFYDERKEVNKIVKDYHLQNPFAHLKTTNYPFHQQLDHILIPEGMKIVRKRMFKVPISDHKALLVDLAI